MKIVDISVHNGSVDFDKMKQAGIEGVMLRSSYGHFVVDKQLQENVRLCTLAQLPYGFYHYSYATNENEMEIEAANFISLAKQFNPSFPLAIDMEDADNYKLRMNTLYNKALNTKICSYTCQQIEKAGYSSMIYASLDWFKNKLILREIQQYKRWLAQWDVQKPSMSCALWQYTDRGNIAGIKGNFDLNLVVDGFDKSNTSEKGGENVNWVSPYVTVEVTKGVGKSSIYYVRDAILDGAVMAKLQVGQSLRVNKITASVLSDGFKWIQVILVDGSLGYMQADLTYLRFLI